MRALHTAATGMMAQELNVQVISNNIANMRTTGYKRQRVEFQDLLYEHVSRIGTQTSAQGNKLPVGIDLGGGVKTVGTPRLMTQGTLSQTGKELRSRDPRRRLLQDSIARRQLRLYPRRLVPDGRARPHRHRAGQLVQPGITIPQNATRSDDQRARPGFGHPPGQRRRPCSGRLTLTRFINKAGLKASATTCSRNARLRHAAGRHPEYRRLRRSAARQSRAGQCRSGQRDLRSDRRATRLRNERQGHHRRRPDAVGDLEPDALRHSHDPHDPLTRCRRRSLAALVHLAYQPPRKEPLSRHGAPVAQIRGRRHRRYRAHRRSGRACRHRRQCADFPRARPRLYRHGAGRCRDRGGAQPCADRARHRRRQRGGGDAREPHDPGQGDRGCVATRCPRNSRSVQPRTSW